MSPITGSSEELQLKAMRSLTEQIPLNDLGLPVGIYRVDLLPFHDYAPDARAIPPQDSNPATNLHFNVGELLNGQGDTADDRLLPLPSPSQRDDSIVAYVPQERRIAGFPAKDLETAFVYLQYDEGFPTFDDGRAFWHQLDFEPIAAYNVFQRYLQMSAGRRANPNDPEDEDIAARGTRSLADLAALICPDDSNLLAVQEKLKSFYHLYYWGLRTHAYDVFRIAQHRKQQELRAIETLDEHYVLARQLRRRVMTYMNSQEDFWDMMSPKVAVDLLKNVTQLERISANMPALAPSSADSDPSKTPQSFEVAFRQVAQHNNTSKGRGDGEEGEVLSRALEDSETLNTLQELIIRVGGN